VEQRAWERWDVAAVACAREDLVAGLVPRGVLAQSERDTHARVPPGLPSSPRQKWRPGGAAARSSESEQQIRGG